MPTDVPSSQPSKCPNCGAVLPDHAPQGLCPRCLFAGVAGPTEDATQGTASRPTPKPEELASHFPQLEILECLGRGGMGIVYKARQKALDRFVALKLLAPERVSDPAFAERFAREAQALAKLNHPNIVTIHDFGEAGGFFYLLMEYVDGVNLRQAMKAGPFTPEQALGIVPPICDALQFAHERGIVHRDIKPENLLLDRDGRVMIADFGIAKMLGTESTTGLAESQPAGTPQYMAPEQRAVPGRVDHRADIYSLGVVFYEMLTGELPAGRIEAPSARMRGVQVDVRIDEIVLRALEKTPEMRYQTAGEFRTQVETVTAPGQHPAHSVSPETARPEGARFSRRAIVGACWAALFPVLAVSTSVVMSATLGPGRQVSPHSYFMWFATLAKLLMLAGMAAPLGTTILGWIAVGEIRRSFGKLRGLALAVFDGLLFPLGALAGLIAWFWWWVFRVLLYPSAIDALRIDGPSVTVPEYAGLVYEHWQAFTFICTLLTAVPLCILIIRDVWRRVNSIPPRERRTVPAAWHKAVAIFLACVLGLVVIGVLMSITWWSSSGSPRPPTDFPSGAHVGTHDGSVFAVQDKTRLHYVIYYPGSFSTSSSGSQNRHSLTWMEEGTIKLLNGRTFGYHRESVEPESLRINGQDFDLRQGRVFVLHDDGLVEMVPLFPTDAVARAPDRLSELIAAHGHGFGPVFHRELSANISLTNAFLDLDRGTVASLPRELVDSLRANGSLSSGFPPASEIREWMGATGMDLAARFAPGASASLVQVDGIGGVYLGGKAARGDRSGQPATGIDPQVSEQQARVAELEGQKEFIGRLRPDEMVQALRELKIDDPTVLRTLPLYHDAVTAEAQLLTAGVGVNHPRVKSQRAQRDAYSHLLAEQLVSIRNAQTSRLRFEREKLAAYEQQAAGAQSPPAKDGAKIDGATFESVTVEAVMRAVQASASFAASGDSEKVWLHPAGAISAFRTREGQMGVLEILDATRDGLKLRYKLVARSPAAEPKTVMKKAAGEGPVAATKSLEEPRSVLEARLAGAKAEAMVKEARYAAGEIDAVELLMARNEVKILEAQLTGDGVLVARVRLTTTKAQLEIAAKRWEAGELGSDDYQRIKTAVAVAEAELREAEAGAQKAKSPR